LEGIKEKSVEKQKVNQKERHESNYIVNDEKERRMHARHDIESSNKIDRNWKKICHQCKIERGSLYIKWNMLIKYMVYKCSVQSAEEKALDEMFKIHDAIKDDQVDKKDPK
jgi:hypothetical protein